MDFYDVVDEALALLQRHGRLSYRALKRQFQLDDAQLEDLKFELVEVARVATDQQGTLLVWRGQDEGPVRTASLDGPDIEVPPTDTRAKGPPPSPLADAERRQLSVLFCDLMDGAALATVLDPEELREVLGEYQRTCADVVERFGGVVARQVGDELLVNFGYPQAHEDNARRAARAGLAIVAELPELTARLAQRFPVLRQRLLQARLGLHTGLAVVGGLGANTYWDPMAVVGETPNIAARLQGLAEADALLVSGATRRLLGEGFACDELGLHQLKGMAVPVMVYRVVGEREAGESADDGAGARFTPLVGREQEIGVLVDRWEQSKEGVGQVLLLSGEAGIGKTRLVRELKARVMGEPHRWLEGRATSHHQQTAFSPITDLLLRFLPLDPRDSPSAKRERLLAALHRHELPVDELSPFLAALLGLPPEPSDDSSALATPQRRRQQTLEALLTLVLRLSARAPVLMVVEDLHWADPSTLEVLGLLLKQAPTARLLLVLTARQEFQTPWSPRAPLTRLTLTRLRRAQVEQMAAGVTGGRSLPDEVVQEVARKTDGIPLFVEELTKMVLESGLVRDGEAGYELAGPLPPLAVPATLQDSLMARLDRLSTTKAVAQLGATLGRTFAYEVLQAVAGLDEATLSLELDKLVKAELLSQSGRPPHATYVFRHALVQDAAYHALLRSIRQQYHERIARTLETRFADTAEARPEMLAHHYTEAGLAELAIPHWQRAGHHAIERSANLEGIAHLTRGLELLHTLPEGPERLQKELDLQVALGPALMATRGYAAPEVEAAYGRARELCRQVGETPRLTRVLLGLGTFYFIRGNLQEAHRLGAECLPMVQRLCDVPRLRQAHLGLGTALFHLGDFRAAHTHLEEALAHPEAPAQHARPVPAAADPHVVSLCYSALTLWMLGYPARGRQRIQEALALAENLNHPYSQTIASALCAWYHQLQRDAPAAERQSDTTVALSSEHGFPLWKAQGILVRGWARARQGRGAGSIADVAAGLTAWQRTGAELSLPNSMAMLADVHGYLGQPAEGVSLTTEGLATMERGGERWIEADLRRLRGELLAACSRGGAEDAETSLRRALEVARGQRARSLELRVAIGLGRLGLRRGQGDAARALLAEVYGSFGEGFDTPDLAEAKSLLADLY